VPFAVGGQASAALVEGATLKVYPGAPHGITDTHKEQLGADLLAFLSERGAAANGARARARCRPPEPRSEGGPPRPDAGADALPRG